MKHNKDIEDSYSLEHQLAQSIDRVADNIVKAKKLKREIVKLRRQRRQLQEVPDDVKQWFEETEPFTDEDPTE